MLNTNSLKPIYMQIADYLEGEILKHKLQEGNRIPSQNELASFFSINAITAAKGVDILERKGIVEKRRGLGMFVTANAEDIILASSRNETIAEIIDDLLAECQKAGVSVEQLIEMIADREESTKDRK